MAVWCRKHNFAQSTPKILLIVHKFLLEKPYSNISVLHYSYTQFEWFIVMKYANELKWIFPFDFFFKSENGMHVGLLHLSFRLLARRREIWFFIPSFRSSIWKVILLWARDSKFQWRKSTYLTNCIQSRSRERQGLSEFYINFDWCCFRWIYVVTLTGYSYLINHPTN